MMRPHLRAHLRNEGPRQGHDRRQVRFQHLVPRLVGDPVDRLRGVHPGVVDQDVHAAHLLQGGAGELRNVGTSRHVGHGERDLAAGLGRDLVRGRLEFGLVAAGKENVGPGLGQPAGHGLAEPLVAAGDEGDAAGQVEELVGVAW